RRRPRVPGSPARYPAGRPAGLRRADLPPRLLGLRGRLRLADGRARSRLYRRRRVGRREAALARSDRGLAAPDRLDGALALRLLADAARRLRARGVRARPAPPGVDRAR